jgi:hypothetical protein
MPLVTLAPVALEMEHRYLTNSLRRGEVWALSHPLINGAQGAEKKGHPVSEHALAAARH